MNHLKRLGLTFTLMSVLAVAALAGETPPCVPGELSSPPCPAQSDDDSAEPGETSTPPASDTVDATDISEAVLWALTLF